MKFSGLIERLFETCDDPIPPEPADIVIGIGTDVSKDGLDVSPQSRAIAEKVLEIFLSGKARFILFTGGYSYTAGEKDEENATETAQKIADGLRETYTEAGCMSSHLFALSVSRNIDAKIFTEYKILHETDSRRTYLNADFTLQKIKNLRWLIGDCKSVIVVAQQWHARRVRATFRKRWRGSGIKISVVKAYSPYTDDNSQWRWRKFWRFAMWDTIAFVISKLKGYC